MESYDNARRLFIDVPLEAGMELSLAPRGTHYLRNVLRLSPGVQVIVFNENSGEWLCDLVSFRGREAVLAVKECLLPPRPEYGPQLMFALVRQHRLNWLIEKATEIGVSQLTPILTNRTTVRGFNLDRIDGITIKAAEQCGRMSVPLGDAPKTLAEAIEAMPDDKTLIYCAERGQSRPMLDVLTELDQDTNKMALLVGPEGGFDDDELSLLLDNPKCHAVGLGPNLLRTETAAICALSMMLARGVQKGSVPHMPRIIPEP